MPATLSARRSASGRGRAQSVDNQGSQDDLAYNMEAEADLRLTGGGWAKSIREGAAMSKHYGRTVPVNSQNQDPGALLEVLWRGRIRFQRSSGLYEAAVKERGYLERGKPPLTSEELQQAVGERVIKVIENSNGSRIRNIASLESEAVEDAFEGVPEQERLRWLITHCHVATNVRPHGFASVGKLPRDSPLAQLLLHGLQLFMAVSFDDSFAMQLHHRHRRSACLDPPRVQLERIRRFYSDVNHNRAKLPPAGTQAPVFDHCSMANQIMFVNQVIEGLMLPHPPLPPDSVYCWSAFNKLLGLGLLAPLEEAAAGAGGEGGSSTLLAAAADLADVAAARQADAAAATSLMAAAVSQLRVSLHDMIQQQQQLGAVAMQVLVQAHPTSSSSSSGHDQQQQQQQLETVQQQSDLAKLLSSSSNSTQRQQQIKLQCCLSTAWPLLLNPVLLGFSEFPNIAAPPSELLLPDAAAAAAAAAAGLQGRHCHVAPKHLLSAAAASGSNSDAAAAAVRGDSCHTGDVAAAAAAGGSSCDSREATAAAAAATTTVEGSCSPPPAEAAAENGSIGDPAAVDERSLEQTLLQQLSQILLIQHAAAAAGSSGDSSPAAAAAAAGSDKALPGLELQSFVALTCHMLLQHMLQQLPPAGDSTVWSQCNMVRLLQLLVMIEKVKSGMAHAAASVAGLRCPLCPPVGQQQQQQQQQGLEEPMTGAAAAPPAGLLEEDSSTDSSSSSSTENISSCGSCGGSADGSSRSGENSSESSSSSSDANTGSNATETLISQRVEHYAREVIADTTALLCDAVGQLRRIQHSLSSAAAAADEKSADQQQQQQQQQRNGLELPSAALPAAAVESSGSKQWQQQAAAAAVADVTFWRSTAVSLYKTSRPGGWAWLGHNFDNVIQHNIQPGFWGLVRYFLAADQLNLRRRTAPVTATAAASSWTDPGYEEPEFGDIPMFCKQAARVADKALALHMTKQDLHLCGVPIHGPTLQQLLRLACLAADSTSAPLPYVDLAPSAAAAATAGAGVPASTESGVSSSNSSSSQADHPSSSSSSSRTAAADGAIAAAAAKWDCSPLHLSAFQSLGPMFAQQQQGTCLAQLMGLVAQYYAEHAAAAVATAEVLRHYVQASPAAAAVTSAGNTAASHSSTSHSSSSSRLITLLMGLYHLQLLKWQQEEQQQQQSCGSMGAAAATSDVYGSLAKRLEACDHAVAEAQQLMDLFLWCTVPAHSSSRIGGSRQQPDPVCDLLAHDFTRLMYIANDDIQQRRQLAGQRNLPAQHVPGVEPMAYDMLGCIPRPTGAVPAAESCANVDPGTLCDGCQKGGSGPRSGSGSIGADVYVCSQCGASMLCRTCFTGEEGSVGIRHLRNHCRVLRDLFAQQCADVSGLQRPGEDPASGGPAAIPLCDCKICIRTRNIILPSCRCNDCTNTREVFIHVMQQRFKFSPLQQLQVPWWKAFWQQQQQQRQQQQHQRQRWPCFAAVAAEVGLEDAWDQAEDRLQFIAGLVLAQEVECLYCDAQQVRWQQHRTSNQGSHFSAAAGDYMPYTSRPAATAAAAQLRAGRSRPPLNRFGSSIPGLRSNKQQYQQQHQKQDGAGSSSARHSPDQLAKLASDLAKGGDLDPSNILADLDLVSPSTWGDLDWPDLDPERGESLWKYDPNESLSSEGSAFWT